MLYAINLFITHSWSLMIGGNDGPTSVFVVGRIGNRLPAMICVLGIIILLYGIFTMLRSNNNDK